MTLFRGNVVKEVVSEKREGTVWEIEVCVQSD